MFTRQHIRTEDRNSQQWLDYFRDNDEHLREIPWETQEVLTESERRTIEESVQIFQLGERSEGKHLAKCAREHAMENDDMAYYEAVKLFIKEEQRHARDLGCFMRLQGISIIQKTPTDSIFRWLRHLANLEMSVSILVAAEIIAQVYYPALQRATNSKILFELCEQIIADEDDHVSFQSQRLAILRRNRSPWLRGLTDVIYQGFFKITSIVVWFGHRSVFQSAGMSYHDYQTTCQKHIKAAIPKMNPSYWRVTR